MKILRWLETHPGWLLAGGMILAGVVNYQKWQRDKSAAERLNASSLTIPAFKRTPKVSVLVPAWNEAANLPACIESILRLRYPDKEVVLCAGGEDGSYTIALQHEGTRVMVLEQQPGDGKQGALKRSFEHCSGEIIFLTDADSRLDNDSFEHTIHFLVEGKEEACTGSRRPIHEKENNKLAIFQWINHLYQECTSPDYIDTLYGINAAIQREALEKAGGFDTPAPIGTDLILGRQLLSAGYRIRYIRHSRVQTDYEVEIGAYIRQLSRWYRNRLMYGLGSGHWGDFLITLRAGTSSCFLLSVPFISRLGLNWLWYLWTPLLLHSILSELRMLSIAAKRSEELTLSPMSTINMIVYLLACWLGMARGLADAINPSKRKIW